MARIVSLGSAMQDIYLVDHDDLRPTEIGGGAIFGKVLVGSEIDIDKLYYKVGGGGINSAITFVRCGHESILMSNVARDSAGEAIFRVLDKEGIDSSYIDYNTTKPTGSSVVLLDSKSGERAVLTHHGASGKFNNLSADDLDLIQPDWLYATTLYGDMETYLKFFEKAHEIGTKIMLNPGKKELEENKKLIGLLEDVDVLLVDKTEASKIVPGTILTELLYHLNNYVPTVIITDGPMGGIAGNRETGEVYRFGIYEDVKIKDKTGAGDAFGSGFLAKFAEGKSFRQSLIFGSANSTAVVKKIGANSGILDGTEELHPMLIQKI